MKFASELSVTYVNNATLWITKALFSTEKSLLLDAKSKLSLAMVQLQIFGSTQTLHTLFATNNPCIVAMMQHTLHH